jgi:hypothetical protein
MANGQIVALSNVLTKAIAAGYGFTQVIRLDNFDLEVVGLLQPMT